jgi:hypothetical protein
MGKERRPAEPRPPGAANRVYEKNALSSTRWKELLIAVANGHKRSVACRRAKVTNPTLQLYLISNPKAVHELRQAELAWIRQDWPIERIEEMLLEIALGSTNKQAAKKLELLPDELEQFMRIVFRDPELKQLYDDARQMQAESWSDEMVEISEDSTGDVSVDKTGKLKIDFECVNRSKLRVDTLKWLMSRLHHERFGDRIKQDVSGSLSINHAELLDQARRRREKSKTRSNELTQSIPEQRDSSEVPPHQQVH